ncbi:MAG TPA: hypothetical protein DCK98_05310 [Chloroflexi bacterium]|nr:hypothetical protein [Chloroflexota bacterium]
MTRLLAGQSYLLRPSLDLYGDGVTSIPHDHKVHALLVTKGEIRGETDPLQTRQDVELGSEIRVIAAHA